MKKKILAFLACAFIGQASLATQSAHFAIIMENHSVNDSLISFVPGVGRVYFDIPLEDDTLLQAQNESDIYGVNYAPNDPQSTFNIVFKNQKNCQFTVGYFTPPESPKVTMTGEGCDHAGYRLDYKPWATLVLFV